VSVPWGGLTARVGSDTNHLEACYVLKGEGSIEDLYE